MVVFKEENGNLYYRIDGGYKQLNNLQYLTASSVYAGLMSTEDKVKLDSITQPTTVVVTNTFSNGVNVVCNVPVDYMKYKDTQSVPSEAPSFTTVTGIEGVPGYITWGSHRGYLHPVLSSVFRNYIMKCTIPSTVTAEDKANAFLRLAVNTTTDVVTVYIYQNVGGTLRRFEQIFPVNSGNKYCLINLDPQCTSFYIVIHGKNFGITSIELFNFGNNNHRTACIFQDKPTTPQLGQTYFCTDYPEGGSTIECMLVYNGNNWIKI